MLKSYSTASVSLADVLKIIQQALDYESKHAEAVSELNTARALFGRLAAVYNRE